MTFKKGSNRVVFVFPSLGIAIKFPFIHLFETIYTVIKHIIHLRFSHIWVEAFISADNEVCWGYRRALFYGIIVNWREFLFFRRERSSFLLPTYFSFFGLFNVQKAGESCLISGMDLWLQFLEFTERGVLEAGHHFQNPENFCINNGELKILDYGDKNTQLVVTKYGKKIQESFDPAYSWKERKKALAAQKPQ